MDGMEQYYEQSVVRDHIKRSNRAKIFIAIYYVMLTFAVISLVVAVFLGFLVVDNWLFGIVMTVGAALLGVGAYGAKRMAESADAEYDYVLIGGRFRIARVVLRKKRKKFLDIPVTALESLGKVRLDAFDRAMSTPGIKQKQAYVSEDEDKVYFAAYSDEGKRMLLLFEPDTEMLRAIRLTLGRDIEAKK
jgi:hypothetical protein